MYCRPPVCSEMASVSVAPSTVGLLPLPRPQQAIAKNLASHNNSVWLCGKTVLCIRSDSWSRKLFQFSTFSPVHNNKMEKTNKQTNKTKTKQNKNKTKTKNKKTHKILICSTARIIISCCPTLCQTRVLVPSSPILIVPVWRTRCAQGLKGERKKGRKGERKQS